MLVYASAGARSPRERERVRPALSAVVPCYNEIECIGELHGRLSAACRDAVGDDYEIVLVNDGSKDGTWAAIERLTAEDPHVIGVDLSRNHGHQLALTAGLAIVAGARIFIIDADLQDSPELPSPMMKRMDEGVDVVYGRRRQREGDGAFKRASVALFYRLLDRLTEINIPTDTGDFRLMSRRALDALLAMPERYRFVRGMVSWIGYRQEPFLYDRAARFAVSTKDPLAKMVRLAFDAVTGFSIQPLRMASHLGLELAVLSITLIVYIIVSWLSGAAVEGWTSLMAVVVVPGSAQMLVLGLIGEY
jgi:dolichol-phosphate mannosyltransferase